MKLNTLLVQNSRSTRIREFLRAWILVAQCNLREKLTAGPVLVQYEVLSVRNAVNSWVRIGDFRLPHDSTSNTPTFCFKCGLK